MADRRTTLMAFAPRSGRVLEASFATNLLGHLRRILRNTEQGADTAIWLAATRPPASAEGISLDRERQPEHVGEATRYDPALREEPVAELERWAELNR